MSSPVHCLQKQVGPVPGQVIRRAEDGSQQAKLKEGMKLFCWREWTIMPAGPLEMQLDTMMQNFHPVDLLDSCPLK